MKIYPLLGLVIKTNIQGMQVGSVQVLRQDFGFYRSQLPLFVYSCLKETGKGTFFRYSNIKMCKNSAFFNMKAV